MSTQLIIRVAEHGSFLGTRALGAKMRDEIVKSCTNNQRITLDFSDVSAMSHSFADECIGGLLAELGTDAFRTKIRFKGMSEEVTSLLRLVTSRRTQSVKSSQQVQAA